VAEFSRAGWGLVPGCSSGRRSGPRKSTLLLEIAGLVAGNMGRLYIRRESARRIRCATGCAWTPGPCSSSPRPNLHAILDHIAAVRPVMAIIDNIQTTYDELKPSAGSVSSARIPLRDLASRPASSSSRRPRDQGRASPAARVGAPRFCLHGRRSVHRYRLLVASRTFSDEWWACSRWWSRDGRGAQPIRSVPG
jgi:hypothetical protein